MAGGWAFSYTIGLRYLGGVGACTSTTRKRADRERQAIAARGGYSVNLLHGILLSHNEPANFAAGVVLRVCGGGLGGRVWSLEGLLV